ncbi:MAG TPA: type II secretion system protein GspG, partial [Phycisphaerae bacterium]|nr:type II secretion system protein GspG [Phycisphaerae bacterium]
MKKCDYCGRDNPDEATQCSGCGMKEFKDEAPPIILSHIENKKEGWVVVRKHLPLRLLIAGCIWLIISGISLHVACQQANRSIAWHQQWETQRQLKEIGQAITAYEQKFNVAPNTFEQLRTMTNDVPEMEDYFEDGFVDGWQHSLIFTNEGTNCLVISYGGDGKPGGKGIDYDLTSENPTPKESLPTFDQFLNNDRVRGMIISSVVCGVLAALLSFLTV